MLGVLNVFKVSRDKQAADQDICLPTSRVVCSGEQNKPFLVNKLFSRV